ncbi:MAG: DUF1501 domain-containing protein [Planctomycetales bacterium]|nr:DUF1501 domain-containing protein [Planctomycetales bacterium]
MKLPEHSSCGCPGAFVAANTRRDFLRNSSCGFGMFALAGLMADRSYAEQRAASLTSPLQAKAKHVIFCFMDGGPSHVDTFDYKPALAQYQGQQIGEAAVSKKSQSNASRRWLGSPWAFQQRGQSGLWVSDLFPSIADCADDICVVRSMVGIQPLHGQQNLLLHTGRLIGQAPSLGSWVSYGLGSENENLPGYVLLNNDWIPNGGFENFSSAFLPANHAATMIRADGEPVDNIVSPDRADVQRRKLSLLDQQDAEFAKTTADSAAIEAAIRNYETAFRMQSAVPDVVSIADEDQHTLARYGIDSDNDYRRFYGLQCLRARRLVEAGVRFVEITCPLTHSNNSPWDQHSKLVKYHNENAMVTEQAVATLIQDLKQRGLLDETIVLWAGEMGRTPHTASSHIDENTGRDHHVDGYSIFLAGGGFRPGFAYGETDEFGNSVVENPLSVHDIHATMLHQMGLDHERLTYRFGGRDVSLTDVHGRVVTELLTGT